MASESPSITGTRQPGRTTRTQRATGAVQSDKLQRRTCRLITRSNVCGARFCDVYRGVELNQGRLGLQTVAT